MAHAHLPVLDEESRPFWDAARERRLLLRHCADCDRPYFYPRPFCPACWGGNVTWIEATGRATLYTYSVVHRNDLPPFGDRVPYVAAVVTLAEGPRMMTNIVDCDLGALHVDMPLQVTFRKEEDLTIPVFAPL